MSRETGDDFGSDDVASGSNQTGSALLKSEKCLITKTFYNLPSPFRFQALFDFFSAMIFETSEPLATSYSLKSGLAQNGDILKRQTPEIVFSIMSFPLTHNLHILNLDSGCSPRCLPRLVIIITFRRVPSQFFLVGPYSHERGLDSSFAPLPNGRL